MLTMYDVRGKEVCVYQNYSSKFFTPVQKFFLLLLKKLCHKMQIGF